MKTIGYIIRTKEEFNIFCEIYPKAVLRYDYTLHNIKDLFIQNKPIVASIIDGNFDEFYWYGYDYDFEIVDFKVELRKRKLEMLNSL